MGSFCLVPAMTAWMIWFVICLMALDVGDCQADGNTTEYDYTYTGTWSTGSTGTDQTDKPTVSDSPTTPNILPASGAAQPSVIELLLLLPIILQYLLPFMQDQGVSVEGPGGPAGPLELQIPKVPSGVRPDRPERDPLNLLYNPFGFVSSFFRSGGTNNFKRQVKRPVKKGLNNRRDPHKSNSKDSKNEEIRVQEVGGPGRAWEFCNDQVGRRSRSPGHLLQEEALLRHHQGHPQYAL